MSPNGVCTLPLPKHTPFLENSDFPESSIAFPMGKVSPPQIEGTVPFFKLFLHLPKLLYITHTSFKESRSANHQYLPFTFADSRLSPYLIH